MTITKDALQQRIASLSAMKEQHIANANAANGAINEANYWLSQLEQEPLKDELKSE